MDWSVYMSDRIAKLVEVKAFNSIYYKVLEDQAFQSVSDRIAVQVASDDPQAKQTVMQLIEDIGFTPQDIGDLQSSTIFEPNALLYNKNLKIREAEAFLNAALSI
jgi:8-hydroxy-5-deazaflavin:NADPH oxidoreductase